MKAVIVAGGTPPSPGLIRKHAENARIFCADSGANACVDAGIIPDVLLGDMDSISLPVLEKCQREGTEILYLEPEKDDTDTEALLAEIMRRGHREIVLLGATGGRIDHLLANIQLLGAARMQGADMVIEDAEQTLRLLHAKDTIRGRSGQTFSLLPYGVDARAHAVENVAYPLAHLDLPWQGTIGISNILTAEAADIVVEKGEVLLVLVQGV